jgi:CheY-like chemotaxis protein
MMLGICRDEPKPFGSVRPDLPNELAAVIARCLEKDRDRRFSSASDVAAALEHVLPRLTPAALPGTPTMVLAPVAKPIAIYEPKVVASPYASKRMLIADDDPAIRRLFEALAKRERIDCDTAANGPEAIVALKEREYALLFLDIMMPRIDGWGVLDYLRVRSKARVPSLFIITAFLDQTVSAADREIVSGIIYKPVDADDIAALMRECVRGGSPTGILQRTRHRLIAAAG